MAKKSSIATNLEYAALRCACALVNAVPYPAAMWLADALAFFAQYGLASEDLDLDEVITASDAAGVMSALANLMGAEWSDDTAADEVMTRGDLATMLNQFLADLGE